VTADLYDREAVAPAETGRLLARARRKLGASRAEWHLARGLRADRQGRHARAVRHFAAASRAGSAEARFRLGLAYARGQGVICHPPDAVRWYRSAAEQGHLEAQFQLSLLYLQGQPAACEDWYRAAVAHDPRAAEWNREMWFSAGIAVPYDYAEALRWSRLAAAQGLADAQANLGTLYLHGMGCERDDAAARHWFELAAEKGNAEAEHGLGMIHANGLGVPIDVAAAAKWYARAADKDHDAAQLALGELMVSGRGVERDPRRAAVLFRAAGRAGNAQARHNLGLLYLRGEGVAPDRAEAEASFRDAARLGLAAAMLSLAEICGCEDASPAAKAEAVLWHKAAAAAGDAEAQFALGRVHAEGRLVPRQPGEAAKWFEKAAEQGHALAQFNLAVRYLQGLGVTRDAEKAVAWYERAAAQGFAAAHIRLAHFVLSSEAAAGERETAAGWLRRAAAAGDPGAQFQLGVLYWLGEGVARDPETAAFWYRRAAQQGECQAQHNLAEILAAGDGVDPDPVEAAFWYEKAAEQGMAASELALGDLHAREGGAARDLEAARRWYERAASHGREEAATRLVDLAGGVELPENSAAVAEAGADPMPSGTGFAPHRSAATDIVAAGDQANSPALEGWPTASAAAALRPVGIDEFLEAMCRQDTDGAIYRVETASAGSVVPRVVDCPETSLTRELVRGYLGTPPAPFRSEPEYLFLVNAPCYVAVATGVVFLGDGRILRETLFPTDAPTAAEGSRTIADDIAGGLSCASEIANALDAAPVIDDGVWAPLFSRWSGIYSHALTESMVQDGVLRRAGLSPLVSYAVPDSPEGAQHLVLAAAQSPVLSFSQPVVKVPRLVFASKLYRYAPLGDGLKGAAADLKTRVLGGFDPAAPGCDKIYVSRLGDPVRPMENEAELIAELARIGFHILAPGPLSLAGLALSFRHARLIVGPYGEALASSVFAAPGAALCELRPLNSAWGSLLWDDYFYRLAATVGLAYGAHIAANPEGADSWRCDIGETLDLIAAAAVEIG
jgi:TPR repeat protein/capsular polysaccharide biosynthesis protein